MFLKVNIGFSVKSSFDELNLQDFSNKDLNNYDFSKVAGNAEAKESLNDKVDFLKTPEKYSSYGAKMPKGIFSSGRTLTVHSFLVAQEAGDIAQAAAVGIVLIIIILLLNSIAKIITKKFNKANY